MAHNKKLNSKKWYRVVVTVYRNSDGYIERDSQELLVDAISRVDASKRAYDLLTTFIYPKETHTINIGAPYELL